MHSLRSTVQQRALCDGTYVHTCMQVGVYVRYEGQQQQLSEEQLQQLRQELPVLPPSLFGENAVCSCCRSQQQAVQQYGAVHGQRIKGELCGSFKFLGKGGHKLRQVLVALRCLRACASLKVASDREQQQQNLRSAIGGLPQPAWPRVIGHLLCSPTPPPKPCPGCLPACCYSANVAQQDGRPSYGSPARPNTARARLLGHSAGVQRQLGKHVGAVCDGASSTSRGRRAAG